MTYCTIKGRHFFQRTPFHDLFRNFVDSFLGKIERESDKKCRQFFLWKPTKSATNLVGSKVSVSLRYGAILVIFKSQVSKTK